MDRGANSSGSRVSRWFYRRAPKLTAKSRASKRFQLENLIHRSFQNPKHSNNTLHFLLKMLDIDDKTTFNDVILCNLQQMLYEYLSALISKIKAWCKRGRNELKRETVASLSALRGEKGGELDIEEGRGREGEEWNMGKLSRNFLNVFLM